MCVCVRERERERDREREREARVPQNCLQAEQTSLHAAAALESLQTGSLEVTMSHERSFEYIQCLYMCEQTPKFECQTQKRHCSQFYQSTLNHGSQFYPLTLNLTVGTTEEVRTTGSVRKRQRLYLASFLIYLSATRASTGLCICVLILLNMCPHLSKSLITPNLKGPGCKQAVQEALNGARLQRSLQRSLQCSSTRQTRPQAPPAPISGLGVGK